MAGEPWYRCAPPTRVVRTLTHLSLIFLLFNNDDVCGR